MKEFETDLRFYQELIDDVSEGVYFVDPQRKISFWNKQAEKLTGYSAMEIVNRFCYDNLLNAVDQQGVGLCKELCPLAKTILDGQPREADIFLHHKEGHRIPVLVRIKPIRDRSGLIIGAVVLFSDHSSQMEAMEKIKELESKVFIDTLTNLPNRSYIRMSLESKIKEYVRYGWTFGVIFMDIDHFKKLNDTYGHDVGDEVLKVVAKTFISNARPFDVIGRWGGEEFIGVLTNVDKFSLYSVAERFRFLVKNSKIKAGQKNLHVTISIGGALVEPDDDLESLIKRADECMYQSKKAGRDKVTIHT